MYKAVKKENGNYGLQRQGSTEVHGDFATLLEALEAGGIAMVANCMISD